MSGSASKSEPTRTSGYAVSLPQARSVAAIGRGCVETLRSRRSSQQKHGTRSQRGAHEAIHRRRGSAAGCAAAAGMSRCHIGEDDPARLVGAFVDQLDLQALDFKGVDPAVTGRPSYQPAVRLKLCIYGYLNRIQSSRRLQREAQRNVELMWLTGRRAPDFKTIAEFRHGNGAGVRHVCKHFIAMGREFKLFTPTRPTSSTSPRTMNTNVLRVNERSTDRPVRGPI